MGQHAEIERQVASGKSPDFATSQTPNIPEALRESVNLLERAKRAALYATLKGAATFAATMEEEQEFLEYVANQLNTLYAMDSAIARALMASQAGDADAQTHQLLARLAVLRLLPQTRAAIEGALTMAFTGEERRQELQAVRAYLGDAEASIVPLQREVAELVVAKGGYPVD